MFWTSVQRKVKSKMAVALIYAVLEWALIFLLLLQGLFSRFVTSFASYFALHPPCILCSRLDHLFDRRHGRLTYRRLLCNSHMLEISALRYCSLHHKLSDASSSSPTTSTPCSCLLGASGERDEFHQVDSSSIPCLEGTLIVDSCLEEEVMRKIPSCGVGAEFQEEKAAGIHAMDSTVCNKSSDSETENADSVRDSKLEGSGAAEDDKFVTKEAVHTEWGETMVKVAEVLVEEVEEEGERSPSRHENNLEGASEIIGFEDCPKVENEESTDITVDHQPIGNGHDDSAVAIKMLDMANEKSPETPVYEDGAYHLREGYFFGRMEESTDSTEWNAATEMGGREDLTAEQLRSALKSERRALNALYAELEEERNASAIATNHTMAMITRLQEEKAAMQMEALHYQRMMEDQSEYDQEALQLLNELMVRREKENRELEKELENCRRKLVFYEKKERRRLRSNNSATERSSIPLESCGSVDGSDDISISLDGSEVNLFGVANGNSPNTLDESFAGFEKERLSILDNLRELEEKLYLMGDDDNGLQKNVRRMDRLMGEDGDGFSNGFVEDERLNGYDGDAKQTTKIVIEEELQDIYERLNVLEADREFLRHGVSTLKKGDKGMELLVEILENLRDLRRIEQRDQNLGEDRGI